MEPLQIMDAFFSEEIRDNYNVAKYFLDWITYGVSETVSGNAFFLEKRGSKILVGNLYDEDFPEMEIPTQDLIDYINLKIENVSK